MTAQDARNQEWVKDAQGRIGLLLRSPNGWDVAYSNETKQSVDLAEYELADPKLQPDGPPKVVEKRGGDTTGTMVDSRKKK